MVMPAFLAMQASPLKCLVNNELSSTLGRLIVLSFH